MRAQVVIGASGQVGEHVCRALEAAGYAAVGTYHNCSSPGGVHLDIRDRTGVERVIQLIRPAVVYLTAGLTNVDQCELHPEEGYAVNVLGVQNVIGAANRVGAKLVYFSSDYVFDGSSGPYREDAPANPLCEYGRQKLIAEHQVALQASDGLIVRTTVVYGWERQGKNFIYRLLDALRNNQAVKVPVDQVGSPTYAPNLAQAVVELAEAGACGVYHVAGAARASRYEFACEAARLFGLDLSLIRPVITPELQQLAQRPLEAGMIIEKAASQISVELMSYRVGLSAMVEEGACRQ
jgi:dTDP-4-dehydrorhamnose reductase